MEAANIFRARQGRTKTDVAIVGEQVRLAYHEAARGLGIGVVAAVVIAAALSIAHPVGFVWLWLGAVLLVSALRFGLVEAQRRSAAGTAASIAPWGRYYTFSAALSGLAWGALGWTLHAVHSPATVGVVVFVLAAVTAVGLATMATLPIAYGAFLFFALVPGTVLLFHMGGPYASLAVLVTLFGLTLLFTATALHRTVRQSIQLGLTNRGLIEVLDAAKAELQRRNASLDAEIAEHRKTQASLRQSEANFRSLAEAAAWGIVVVRHHRLLYANPTARHLLGEEAARGDIRAWLDDAPVDIRLAMGELLRTPEPTGVVAGPVETTLPTADDEARWGEVSLRGIVFAGEPAAMITLTDVTERKAFAEALFREKERLRVTLGSIGDGVVATDPAGQVEYLNGTAERMMGWPAREAKGLPLASVLCLTSEESACGVVDPVAASQAAGRAVRLPDPAVLVHRSGAKEVSVEITAAPIRDRDGATAGAVVVLHDVSDLRSLARQLAYQASHDPLTGLINRREFEARLQQALRSAQEAGRRHALCYLDLDKFKTVNDRAGHAAGDALLVRLAEVVGRRLEEDQVLGRLGGDEFGVLLTNTDLARALGIAERLREAVRAFRFLWDGHVFDVGVSIGIVPISGEDTSLTDVLRAADSACYAAKDRGCNHVHVFQPTDADPVRRHGHMHWGARIQEALDRRHFRLVAQPILPLRPEEAHAGFHELLLRMAGEHGALVEPGQFLPAAERYHLMPAIDRWVVDHAFDFIARAQCGANDDRVCMINLSEQSLQERTFLTWLMARFTHDAPDPQRICFEIKETALMHDLSWVQEFMDVLKAEGCRFALDDFGTGLSAFGHLKHLPVDYLKIDGSFVRNMVRDRADQAMVTSIHRMAQDLGIRTIAEGVEDAETERALRALGVDYLQGRWLGAPEPVADRLQAHHGHETGRDPIPIIGC